MACALLMLIPLALCSCRTAGREIAGGAFDELDSYLASPRGQATIAAATERNIEAGAAKTEAKIDGLIKSLDPKIGPMGVAIVSAGFELSKPYIGQAVDGGVEKLEEKRAELQAKKDAGTATPWEGIMLSLVTAVLAGYSAYQKGHRTGETVGWNDAANGTGNGTAPKT